MPPQLVYLAKSNENDPMQVLELAGKLDGVWSYLSNRFHGVEGSYFFNHKKYDKSMNEVQSKHNQMIKLIAVITINHVRNKGIICKLQTKNNLKVEASLINKRYPIKSGWGEGGITVEKKYKESPFEKEIGNPQKEYFIQFKIIDFVVGVESIILVLSLWGDTREMHFLIKRVKLLTKFRKQRQGKPKN